MTGYAKVFPQVGDALTPQLKYMTVFFYCVIPILGWFVTIFIMRFYRLDKKAMSILYTKKGRKSRNEESYEHKKRKSAAKGEYKTKRRL